MPFITSDFKDAYKIKIIEKLLPSSPKMGFRCAPNLKDIATSSYIRKNTLIDSGMKQILIVDIAKHVIKWSILRKVNE